MIRCLNTLLCKKCKIEADGLMTVASIYSMVMRKDMPATIQLCFVSFMELSIEEYEASGKRELDIRVIINAPRGGTISDTHTNVAFKQISDKLAQGTLIVEYGETVFMEFGQYTFEIFESFDRLGSATLDIVHDYEN